MLEIDSNGDLVVSVEDDRWMLNPAAVTYVTEPQPQQTMGAASDTSDEDPLGTKY